MPRIPGLHRVFRLGGQARQIEREVDDELTFHFAEEERRLAARGLDAARARQDAERRFGDVRRYRDELTRIDRGQVRAEQRADWWEALRDDLRYALRGIRRQPGFAIVVALTFALGIGANAVMFGVIDRLLLRPPAHVVAPDALYTLESSQLFQGERYGNTAFAASAVREMAARVPAFTDVVGSGGTTMSLGRGARAEPVDARFVSGNFFTVLGTKPLRGRVLLPADDAEPTGAPVAVIGEGFWRRQFGGRPDVLGQSVELNGQVYTVVGVTPRAFAGVDRIPPDIWLPMHSVALNPVLADRLSDDWQWLTLTGRLRAGATPALATEQVTRALRSLGGQREEGARDTTTLGTLNSVLPMAARGDSPEARVSTLLLAVSGFVLLIACANVANLLLARAVARQREIAVRLALGISRRRLVRQLLTEGMVMALLGGVGAVLVLRWGGRAVERLLLGDAGALGSTVDGRTLVFLSVATVIAGLLASLLPALQGGRLALTSALRTGAGDGGGRRARSRALLLTLQTALAAVLLVGTGVFVRSLIAVQQTRLGMDTSHVLVGRMPLRSQGIEPARVASLFEQAAQQSARVPGVSHTALAAGLPLSSSYSTRFRVPGRDSLPHVKDGGPYVNAVSADYLATMGTRVLRGRGFTAGDDRPTAQRVAVINEAMARLYWPDADPIGQCVQVGADSLPCTTIIGIVENARRQRIVEPVSLQYLVPLAHAVPFMRDRVLFARLAPEADPATTAAAVKRAMQGLGADLPYADVFPMRDLLGSELRPWRLGASMFGAFGVLALTLAAIGLYSVISFGVAQRTREIGVRLALGAESRDVLGLVVRQGVVLAAGGALIGAVIAYASGPLVDDLLYETSPRDPAVFAGVLALILFTAFAASLLPALRATRVDPAVALRSE